MASMVAPVDDFHAQLETAGANQLSFEDRFALLVDQQWLW
jgi:hypothetical protein